MEAAVGTSPPVVLVNAPAAPVARVPSDTLRRDYGALLPAVAAATAVTSLA